MARHAEILDSFKEKMENFDYSNEEHMTCVRRFLDYGFSVHSVKACILKFVCLKPKIQYTLLKNINPSYILCPTKKNCNLKMLYIK